MLKTTEWWCDLNRTGRTRRSSPKKPTMSSTDSGRLDGQLYMFAAEDGVDTTWCRGVINSGSEVARFWRLLEFGMEENIRHLQPSLEMLVCRGTGDCAGRQAGRQAVVAKGMTPGPGVGQQCGLMGGVGRAASVELGGRDESKQENLGAGPAEPAQCRGSRNGQHANGLRRRRVLLDMRARTAQKKRRYRGK